MLQRAASNAYSWWWASHIRTTQSKWLDANLQEMENRVKIMLKLLGEEADSFGKRAEMYYHRRPEVISHVEEVYRAYRALVERYDHISKEFHKANHTIATACPEEVQYAMLEEEDDNFPKAITPIDSRKIHKPTVEDILKKKREGQSSQNEGGRERFTCHMSKEKAEEEISRLQKAILVLQTEKEFIKSSYENGIAKYWEIEKQMADIQEEICHIQDAFDANAVIEDVEARALMTATALKSCQGTVARLLEQYEELIRLARIESERIKSLREKLKTMKGDHGKSPKEPVHISVDSKEIGMTNMKMDDGVYSIDQGIFELQPIYEKIEKFFEVNSDSSVEEMAEKVDELVDKVMNLELKFLKQSARINQLKEENNDLEKKLDELQDEMTLRDNPSDLDEQLRQVEEELNRVEVLESSILEEEVVVSTTFAEVFDRVTDISKEFESNNPENQVGLSGPAGNGKTVLDHELSTKINERAATHDGEEKIIKENDLMQGEEFRDEPSPKAGNQIHLIGSENINSSEEDSYSLGGTDDIQDLKNDENENFLKENGLMQKEEFRDEDSTKASDHHLIISSESINNLKKTDECHEEGSSEEVAQSSLSGIDKILDMENDGRESFVKEDEEEFRDEESAIAGDQIHLAGSENINNSNENEDCSEEGSSSEVGQSSLGGADKIQDLNNDGEENLVKETNLILEEEFGDESSPKAGNHIHLIGSANINNLNKRDERGEEDSSADAAQSSSGGIDKIQDLKHGGKENFVKENSLIQEEQSPKAGDQLIVSENINNSNRRNDSIEGGEGPRDLQHMDNHISHHRLEKKDSKRVEHVREASTSSNRRSRSIRREKFTSLGQEGAPIWQEFLLNGLEGREAILLADYTSVLRNYKETKRRLTELEKKNQEHLEETKAIIRELRNANSMKYVEIQSLRDLLDSSEMPPSNNDTNTARFSSIGSLKEVCTSNHSVDREISTVEETNLHHTDGPKSASPFEEKFRSEIDVSLEENLQFLLRYSMACHRTQEFDNKFQELQNEMEKLEDEKTEEPSNGALTDHLVKQQPKPVEMQLRALKTELDVWFEQNALLRQDLQLKVASLCSMQEEIAEALRASSDIDGARFTPYEAAKFQGEVLNMQQSNSKIENELQAALDHMTELKAKVNEASQKLRESFELSSRHSSRPDTESSYQSQFKHFPSRTRVPLRNFLFSTKPKKKSFFACINPTLQKQFSDL